MCTIEGCGNKPVAKGLCAKHYMRLRRTGDPLRTRRSGPKPSALVAAQRELLRDCSDRAFARYRLALELLPSKEDRKRAIAAASRPNGSLNISKLLDIAMTAAVRSALAEARTDLETDKPFRD